MQGEQASCRRDRSPLSSRKKRRQVKVKAPWKERPSRDRRLRQVQRARPTAPRHAVRSNPQVMPRRPREIARRSPSQRHNPQPPSSPSRRARRVRPCTQSFACRTNEGQPSVLQPVEKPHDQRHFQRQRSWRRRSGDPARHACRMTRCLLPLEPNHSVQPRRSCGRRDLLCCGVGERTLLAVFISDEPRPRRQPLLFSPDHERTTDRRSSRR